MHPLEPHQCCGSKACEPGRRRRDFPDPTFITGNSCHEFPFPSVVEYGSKLKKSFSSKESERESEKKRESKIEEI